MEMEMATVKPRYDLGATGGTSVDPSVCGVSSDLQNLNLSESGVSRKSESDPIMDVEIQEMIDRAVAAFIKKEHEEESRNGIESPKYDPEHMFTPPDEYCFHLFPGSPLFPTTLSSNLEGKQLYQAVERTKQDHGTVNCYIMCNGGVVVGTDSRATRELVKIYKDKSKLNALKPENKHYRFILSDTEPKYKELTISDGTRVGLTACGSKTRKDKLWKFCEAFVKYSMSSVDVLAGAVSKFIKAYKPQTEKEKFYLYIVGYSVPNKAYVVHHLGDDREDKTYSSLDVDLEAHPHYGAIGSGSAFALQQLEKLVTPNMSYEKAVIAMNTALVFSCYRDVGCGGELTVSWISRDEDGRHRSTSDHCINKLLGLSNFKFSPKTLMFFSVEEYDKMNYYVLHECLSSFPIFTRTLGTTNGGYHLFMVSFKNEEDAKDCYAESDLFEVYKDGIRGVTTLTTMTLNTSC